MDELVDLFLNLSRNTTVPEGTVVLIGSISHLAKVGVHGYTSACINAKRRVSGAIKGSVTIPFIPPPLGGCNDPEVIRSIVDTCIWLGSIPGYTLSETCEAIVNMVMEDPDSVMGGEGGVVEAALRRQFISVRRPSRDSRYAAFLCTHCAYTLYTHMCYNR